MQALLYPIEQILVCILSFKTPELATFGLKTRDSFFLTVDAIERSDLTLPIDKVRKCTYCFGNRDIFLHRKGLCICTLIDGEGNLLKNCWTRFSKFTPELKKIVIKVDQFFNLTSDLRVRHLGLLFLCLVTETPYDKYTFL